MEKIEKSQCFQELLEADVAYLTQIGYQPKTRKYVDVQVTVNGWSLTVGAKSHGLAFQPTSPLKPLGQLLPYLVSQGQRNESLFKCSRFVNQDGLEAMIITYLVHFEFLPFIESLLRREQNTYGFFQTTQTRKMICICAVLSTLFTLNISITIIIIPKSHCSKA